ncbi:hypothetical protein [Sandaracinus amylolyticus]|uniref:hypothetical protein n=1 Tax=Sandaracinus amylolyticus TaxID=927083 RepID=UPI001F19D98F|nr:hypothetical protein [Sandaracinus amylolyticus]UJR83572.1 Hypothetical protein I5071_56400 [Sandaracinus amylolyticus]
MPAHPPEFEENDEHADSPSDTSSTAARDPRRSVDAPYRDRHDALVWRGRALARELDEAERAVARRDGLARRLAVIDETLRAEARPLLESLEVARPCKARWDDMQGDDVVRRCARCDREVYDVARMTRAEAEALFARGDESPCVRLRRRADGRVVTADCPVEAPSLLARLATAGVAGAIAGGAVSAVVAMTTPATTERAEPRPATVVAASPVRARPLPVVHVGALTSEPEPEILGQALERFDDSVRLLGPATYEIDRERFLRFVEARRGDHPAARFIAYERDRRIERLRVFGLRRTSPLGVLGIQNGDSILDVNGMAMELTERALAEHVRHLDLFIVRIERRGEERVHVYHVRD